MASKGFKAPGEAGPRKNVFITKANEFVD